MANFFVKINGFKGSATGLHAGWLRALNISFGPPRDKTVLIFRTPDSLSHSLWLAQTRGTALGTVIIEAEQDGKRLLRLELADVYIDSVSHSGNPPVETTTFEYKAAKITFQADSASGAGVPLTTGALGGGVWATTP